MNTSENKVKSSLEKIGCSVLRNGWPDFLVVLPNKKIIAIEVKGSNYPLPRRQRAVHELLQKINLEVITIVIKGNIEVETLSKILREKFDKTKIEKIINVWREEKEIEAIKGHGEVMIRGTSPRVDLREYWDDVKAGKVI